MVYYKKLLPVLFVFAAVSACGSPVVFDQPVVNTPNSIQNGKETKVVNLTNLASAKKVFVADYGTKTGVSFSVNLNFPKKSFETKSNDGQLAKTASDIMSFNVGLTTNLTDPIEGDIGGFDLDRSSGSSLYSVTFQNVPAGGPYYAYVKAYDANGGMSGTGNEIIKENNGNSPYSGSSANQRLAVSTNDVTVNADLTLTPAAQILDVTINLEDGLGAGIDTDINVNDGIDPTTFTAI